MAFMMRQSPLAMRSFSSSRSTCVRPVASLGKQDLIDLLAKRTDVTKTAAAESINYILDTIKEEVAKGNDVVIPGFGSWKRVKKEARICRNPQTGEPLSIAEKFAPRFGFGQPFKDVVNGKVMPVKAVKAPKVPKAPKAPKAAAAPKVPKAPAAAKAQKPAAAAAKPVKK